MSSKRPRSTSPTSSPTSSPPPSPSAKLARTIPSVLYTSLTCTLPPTCSHPHQSTRLSSAHDVEEHYAKYHTYVCEVVRCKCVFPDGRFLELHFAECHDPIIALKKERGEKIFACYLATCSRSFMTPKGRRLHLIQSHGYPKQYFFAVTNKGIGGLLQKWGQGASLYRGDWRPRMKDHDMKSGSETGEESGSESGSEIDIENSRERPVNGKQRPPHLAVGTGKQRDLSMDDSSSPGFSSRSHAGGSPESDTLTHAMSSLSLVPDKIRFGRGGKKGGFVHPPPPRSKQTGRGVHSEFADDMGCEKPSSPSPRGRNHGGRRRAQRKTCEGAGTTSGEADTIAAV